MTNDKSKIKELVSEDEDPTAELEVISFSKEDEIVHDADRESDANTFGFGDEDDAPRGPSVSELQFDLETRTRTIGRLQYDIEQLRAKWLGLETEIKAREKIVTDLSLNIEELRENLSRKDKLIRKRDATIRSLKTEIRDREEAHRSLLAEHASVEQRLDEYRTLADEASEALRAADRRTEELGEQLRQIPKQAEVVVESQSDQALKELQSQLLRTESYADDLRIKLQDLGDSHDVLLRDKEQIARSLATQRQKNKDQSADLSLAKESIDELEQQVAKLGREHEEELRILRFELGEAQTTIAETGDINSQLTADLMDTRGYKEELERMLTDSEARSQHRIEELEKDLEKLSRSAEDYEQKLDSKSAAINVLLNELTKKSEQIEAIGEIEDVIQDIDDRMSERIEETPESARNTVALPDREREKVTRVLIGSIGDQVLRFPLFKDRLTIGRTADNDIQLKLSYISRRHAVVMTEGDTTRVIDWGSKNGVYVNSMRVKEHFLSHGDIVAVGNAKFRYEERRKRD